MAILDRLDFAGTGLSIAYRGSEEEQLLTIRMEAAGANTMGIAPMNAGSIQSWIEYGLGGGAEFNPGLGQARLVSGDLDPLGRAAAGPTWEWVFAVRGVSPRFLRLAVDRLRVSGDTHPITKLSITGSLPVDRSRLSVRESDVVRWLEDAKTFPEVWPHVPFPVNVVEVMRGASIRIRLQGKTSRALLTEFTDAVAVWRSSVLFYPDAVGKEQGTAPLRCVAASSLNEYSARFDRFNYLRAPTQASLINALVRFHEAVAPVEEAWVGIN